MFFHIFTKDVIEMKEQIAIDSATKLDTKLAAFVKNTSGKISLQDEAMAFCGGKFIEPLCQMLEDKFRPLMSGPPSEATGI
jgi:hypothetical protein